MRNSRQKTAITFAILIFITVSLYITIHMVISPSRTVDNISYAYEPAMISTMDNYLPSIMNSWSLPTPPPTEVSSSIIHLPEGELNHLAAHPLDPSIIYATSTGLGAARGITSKDNGATWSMLHNMLDMNGPLAVHPTDVNTLLATIFHPLISSILYRSNDGGESWQSLEIEYPLPHSFISSIVSNVNEHEDAFYVAAYSSWSSNESMIGRTQDKGDSWDWVTVEIGKIHRLYSGGALPNTFYAVTTDGFYISNDYGVSWQRALAGESFAMATKRLDSNTIYVAEGPRLQKSGDGGQTWSVIGSTAELEEPFPVPASIKDILIDPTDDNTLYIVAGIIIDTRLYRSYDEASDWVWLKKTSAYTSPGDQYVAVMPDGRIYADRFVSFNRGETWEQILPRSLGSQNDRFIRSPIGQPHILTTAGGGPAFVSENTGDSWRLIHDSFSRSFSFDPFDVNIMYDCYTGQHPSNTALIKSTDMGQSWQTLVQDENLGCSIGVIIPRVFVLPNFPDRIFDGTRFTAYDVESGQVMYQTETHLQARDVAATPFDDSIVVGGHNGVLKSNDGGMTWIQTGYSQGIVNKVSISSVDPNLILAVTSESGVILSMNQGETWSSLNLPANVYDAAFDPRNPDTIYFSSWSAIYRSYDLGQTWEPLIEECGGTSLHILDTEPITVLASTQEIICRWTDQGPQ